MKDVNADKAAETLTEVFIVFLKLGVTSFGGPIAHIGYFRDEFVTRRKWLSEHVFGEFVTLCQFLPGPTSSQIGFLIGLHRGGASGALLAWLGFTAPSAVIMMLVALGTVHFDGSLAQSALHGLKLVAVIIVMQALWSMSQSLTPDRIRMTIALSGAAMILLAGHPAFQVLAIAAGAVLGIALCRTPQSSSEQDVSFRISRRAAVFALIIFCILLFGFTTLANLSPIIGFMAKFFQSGSLVFGGGHVVLPLLEQEFVATGAIDKSLFLAGYGATQAVPGPLFTFASYLGVLADNGPRGIFGGLIATLMIFLPGFLLVIVILPFWGRVRENRTVRSAISGANAAVVGVLGAALYQPIWTSSITRPSDLVIMLTGYVLLVSWRLPVWAIVLLIPSAAIIQTHFRLSVG